MANNIHLYKGTVTAGSTNGTQVSEGTEAEPIVIGPLNATNDEESSPVKLAIRCAAGYASSGNVTITPTGTSAAKWSLAPDSAGSAGVFGAYGAALTIASAIGDTNTIFWIKAKAASDEPNPVNDISVNLAVAAVIAAV